MCKNMCIVSKGQLHSSCCSFRMADLDLFVGRLISRSHGSSLVLNRTVSEGGIDEIAFHVMEVQPPTVHRFRCRSILFRKYWSKRRGRQCWLTSTSRPTSFVTILYTKIVSCLSSSLQEFGESGCHTRRWMRGDCESAVVATAERSNEGRPVSSDDHGRSTPRETFVNFSSLCTSAWTHFGPTAHRRLSPRRPFARVFSFTYCHTLKACLDYSRRVQKYVLPPLGSRCSGAWSDNLAPSHPRSTHGRPPTSPMSALINST